MTVSTIDAIRVRNLAKYTTSTAINHSKSFGDAVKEGAGFAVFDAGVWAFMNRKNLKAGWQALGAKQAANQAIMRQHTAGGKTIGSIWNGASEIAAKNQLEVIAAGKKASAAKTAAENALRSGTNYVEALKGIEESKGFWGKFMSKAKVGGAGMMAAFELVIGTITDVIPTFKQLGTEKGFKQLGKTTVKAAATGVGWWAGSVVGAKAGAVIGTAIGGPVGTAIGGAVGFICGAVGSWLCNKAADQVIGPSELEKAQKETEETTADQITQQVAATGEGLDELVGTAYTKLIENYIANGNKLDEKGEQAKKDIEAIAGVEINMEEAAESYKREMQEREKAGQTQGQPQTQAQSQVQAPDQTQQQVTPQGTQSEQAQQTEAQDTITTPVVPQTQIQGAEAEEAEEEAKAEAEEKAKQEKAQKEETLSQIFGSLTAQTAMPSMMTPQISYISPTTGIPYYINPMMLQQPQMIGFNAQ